MSLHISSTSTPSPPQLPPLDSSIQLVTPADCISSAAAGFMRGHGTYTDEDELYAAVAGRVERVNKLIAVKPLKTRFEGDIGDVVVGRVVDVQTRRWLVDVSARLNAVLVLSAVNLPGGELRRKSLDDELMMRDYLREGDLLSAEVQSIYQDGSLSLHTRSMRYGKLGQGVLIRVPPALVPRRKTHFHQLPCGASVILGTNGYIWISPVEGDVRGQTGGFVQNLEQIPKTEREVICRLRNCIHALAAERCCLSDSSIMAAYKLSTNHSLTELLLPENRRHLAAQTRRSLEEQMNL